VLSNASSAALSNIQAAEEHLKEQDDIAEQIDKLAVEELELEEKRAAEAAAGAAEAAAAAEEAAAAAKRKRGPLTQSKEKRS
jgi:hypothetical protein